MTDDDRLPSWRPGAARDAIIEYLDGIGDVPLEERVAYVDNDGTMWCERPAYIQLDFFLDALRRRTADDPALAQRPEFDAVLRGDPVAMGEIGLAKIAVALAGLFDGDGPREFGAAVDEFVEHYRHPDLDVPVASLVYQPMLELIDELRAHDFTVGVVTGGGTEFVRRVSRPLYGVPPHLVVGTLIGYEFDRDDDGRPVLRRTVALMGHANEGAAKVEHIQSQLGRAPLVAVGNTGGDREMLEWANAGPHPGLAILIDHDDADREYAYRGEAATLVDAEQITDVAARHGWVVVSMRNDWSTVFPTRS
ncbi:MAG TPA: haloacid dehalogenase-like hydrolase [Euzebyales bacterium]|nr:haloacid dehalogenase-like hydrolase [Euzebyales bacterium]